MSKLLKFMVTCVTCSLFLLLISTTTIEARDSGFNETKQTSKQWSVQLDEAKKGKDLQSLKKENLRLTL